MLNASLSYSNTASPVKSDPSDSSQPDDVEDDSSQILDRDEELLELIGYKQV